MSLWTRNIGRYCGNCFSHGKCSFPALNVPTVASFVTTLKKLVYYDKSGDKVCICTVVTFILKAAPAPLYDMSPIQLLLFLGGGSV